MQRGRKFQRCGTRAEMADDEDIEAVRLGVHEYLIKPVSARAIYDRLVSILAEPRPVVQMGDYYGPEPRKLFAEPLQTVPASVSAVEALLAV